MLAGLTSVVAGWKSARLASSVLAASLAFASTELTTHDIGYSLAIAAISAALGAFFTSIPKIILARKDARESLWLMREKETAALIHRINEANALQVSGLMDILRVSQTNSMIKTVSKHAIGNVLHTYELAMSELREIMRENGLAAQIPEFRRPDIEEILTREDKQTAALVKKRIET